MPATPLFDQLADAPQALSVSALTAQIQALFEQAFATVWVVGEISSFKRHGSGHVYFNLKDDSAAIRAVIWRGAAQRIKAPLADGMAIVARGRLGVYAPRGDYQLYVDAVQLQGAGARELALRQLKEKLARLGWFAAERKRPLPRFPRRLALVTSPTGAAVRDMLEKLAERWPVLEILVCPVRVQGETAPAEIAAALARLNRLHTLDAILLGRGGGSSDDLAAFNTEVVAQAIVASRAPVVSAVGHEVDVTIADLVADCRALTPTDAAVRATPDQAELRQWLRDGRHRLRELLAARVRGCRERLEGLAGRRVFRLPLERLRDRERLLDDTEERMLRAIRQRVEGARQQAETRVARLHALSPLQVLARGYSLTRKADTGAVIRAASAVRPGESIEVLLADGKLLAEVRESMAATASVNRQST